MTLIQKCAQEIASSTAAIIGHNLIITDVDGRIIGASQTERVGQLHEASLEVARTGTASETTREQARLFRGTLPGVTFPIRNLNGRTVGTMALTGSPDEVRPFGLIVKKQIEILLRERELHVYSSSRESIIQNLIHDLETFVPGVGNETMLQSRAIELGYDPSLFYIPIVVDLYQFGRYALAVRRECRDGDSGQVEMRILNVKKPSSRRCAAFSPIRTTFPASAATIVSSRSMPSRTPIAPTRSTKRRRLRRSSNSRGVFWTGSRITG